jgi:hypothetical protein
MTKRALFQFSMAAIILLIGPVSYAKDSVSDRYVSIALQGDLSPAADLFLSIDAETTSLSTLELANRFQARFIEQREDFSPATGDLFADAVVMAYRRYWAEGLMGTMTTTEADLFLEQTLGEVIFEFWPAEAVGSTAAVFTTVGTLLREQGFHFLESATPPYRDLFLWRNEDKKRYSVRLTDRTQKVSVTFMSDLYSLGWKHFATLGLVSTTGWVDGDRLYCIGWAYDRESENFEVSYLKHEGRHLADFQRFKDLPSTELEYRAKLTELAFASFSQMRLLDDFTRKSTVNPGSPHGYANYRVTRDLYHELHGRDLPELNNPWQGSTGRELNLAARELLRRNTEQLMAAPKDGQ